MPTSDIAACKWCNWRYLSVGRHNKPTKGLFKVPSLQIVMRNTWGKALATGSAAGFMLVRVWWTRWSRIANLWKYTCFHWHWIKSCQRFLCLSSYFPLRLNIKNEKSKGECAAHSAFNWLQGEVRLMGPNLRLRGDQQSRGALEQ